MKRSFAGLAVAFTLAVSPLPASAAVLGFVEGHYVYVAADGEANDLTIAYSSGRMSLDDDYAIALDSSLAGRNCEHPFEGTASEEPDKATCDFVPEPLIGLGDLNDSFRGDISTAGGTELVDGGAGEDSLWGGPGDDVLSGGDDRDRVFGDGGDDQVFGDAGADGLLLGGDGDDLVDGGAGDDLHLQGSDTGLPATDRGADRFVGGDGSDRLSYDGHPDAVTITIDEQANDGRAGEGDNVAADIEEVHGSQYGDRLTGGDGSDGLTGGGGNDLILGGAGGDVLWGSSGDDDVQGGAGDDTAGGGHGDDKVDGGSGRDSVHGDGLGCGIICDSGNDMILVRDGETDQVNCGPGGDSVDADESDVASPNCESLHRPAGSGGGGQGAGGGSGPGPGPGMGPGTRAPSTGATLAAPARIRSASLVRSGLRITVTCPGPCAIDARLLLPLRDARRVGLAAAKRVRIGRARATLGAAGTAKLRVKLSAKAKRKLRRLRRATMTLEVAVTQAGTTRKLSKRVALKG